jgi:hypothetical protein
MASMKKTLLEHTQSILERTDGDEVNSINDTTEATQIADIIVQCYFDLVANNTFPEHRELFKLTALADSERPNYLQLPDDVDNIETMFFWYNKSTTAEKDYQRVNWCDPIDFIEIVHSPNSTATNVKTVLDFNGDTELLIYNDRMPSWFTSFDDKHIVCDSWLLTTDSTLQSSKTKCWGSKIPTVTIADTTTFDIDADQNQYLHNEALARVSYSHQKTVDPKAEQWSNRFGDMVEARKHRFPQNNVRSNFGRHR